MKNFLFIGTWNMSYTGMEHAINKKEFGITNFIENSISYIEDYPLFQSVGKGGLPNWDGNVEMDAGYMNGKSLEIGALIGVKEIANPIKAAIKLSKNKYNRMLSGNGALKWAKENNFKTCKMETDKSLKIWKDKIEKLKKVPSLKPYDGHDTVCFLGTDFKEDLIAATSTSGLFMKKPGRIGDSPLVGSGFYADNKWGAAAATGLGEDIARGILSYKVIENIKKGLTPEIAAQKTLNDFTENMVARKQDIGSISLIAINKDGEWGVATNCLFQFSVFSNEMEKPELYLSKPNFKKRVTEIKKASIEYIEKYKKSIEI